MYDLYDQQQNQGHDSRVDSGTGRSACHLTTACVVILGFVEWYRETRLIIRVRARCVIGGQAFLVQIGANELALHDNGLERGGRPALLVLFLFLGLLFVFSDLVVNFLVWLQLNNRRCESIVVFDRNIQEFLIDHHVDRLFFFGHFRNSVLVA